MDFFIKPDYYNQYISAQPKMALGDEDWILNFWKHKHYEYENPILVSIRNPIPHRILYEVDLPGVTVEGEFHMFVVDPWIGSPILLNVGTLSIPLLTYVLIKTQIKRVPIPISDTNTGIMRGYIKNILNLNR